MVARYVNALLGAATATTVLAAASIAVRQLPFTVSISTADVQVFAFNALTSILGVAFTIRASRNLTSAVYRDLARQADASQNAR